MSDGYIKKSGAVGVLANIVKNVDIVEGYQKSAWDEYEAFADEQLALVPLEDVEPIRHGHWEKCGEFKFINLDNAGQQYKELGYPHRPYTAQTCSRCRMTTIVDKTIMYDYCPHCGARMDEGAEE